MILRNQNLTEIPIIPEGIKVLDLSYNQIRQISNLPKSLKVLNLSYNKLKKIENLPKGLKVLTATNNKIREVVLPKKLKRCDLSHNKLSFFPKSNIQNLNLNNNLFVEVSIEGHIQNLSMQENQIKKIIKTPENLETLYLSFNQIKKINNLSNQIQHLYLEDNLIKKIENLPTSLKTLYLPYNQIEHLYQIPLSIECLNVNNNLVKKIPKSLLDCQNLIFFQVNTLEKEYPKLEKIIQDNINQEMETDFSEDTITEENDYNLEDILSEESYQNNSYETDSYQENEEVSDIIYEEETFSFHDPFDNILFDFNGELLNFNPINFYNNYRKILVVQDIDPITHDNFEKGMEVCQCGQCQKYFGYLGFKQWVQKDYRDNFKASCPYCRYVFPIKDFEILTFE